MGIKCVCGRSIKIFLFRVVKVTCKWKNLHLLFCLENTSFLVVDVFPWDIVQETGFSLFLELGLKSGFENIDSSKIEKLKSQISLFVFA